MNPPPVASLRDIGGSFRLLSGDRRRHHSMGGAGLADVRFGIGMANEHPVKYAAESTSGSAPFRSAVNSR